MSANTPVEGYPYPLTPDFADVQDAFRLATSIDADIRAEQAPFRAFMGRPSFIGRQTVTGSGFLAGSQNLSVGAIEWDNTGGLAVGSSVWSQPLAQQPSWWLFGTTILVNIVSGVPVVGDMNMGQIAVNTTDPVTTVVSSSNFYQRNDDTNTNGEWINFFAMAPIYQGSASCTLILNGSTQKAVQLGSRFWGMYLGPVT
jgi:hypothetical protein